MFNYLIKIEYDGTKFVGWQFQKNGISIQEKIEKTLKKIFKSKIKIIGAGRTDKGVHANGQCANFIIKNKIGDTRKLLNSINFFLKNNLISILDIKKKKLNFHSMDYEGLFVVSMCLLTFEKRFFILDLTQKKEFMNIVLLIG